MEQWQVQAREGIRDLVSRYNANGDTGRFPQVIELFAPDAVMVTIDGDDTRTYDGRDQIRSMFTGAKETFRTVAAAHQSVPYVRHFVATHQIDLTEPRRATGRCYFQVLMGHGLDHWGRYVDTYVEIDGEWKFQTRHVRIDGRVATAPSTT